MKNIVRQNLLVGFLISLLSCGQTNKFDDKDTVNHKITSTNQFPFQKAKDKYNELLDIKGSYNYISVDTASIKLLTENEITGLDNFDCYRFTIFNGAHYEYNSGQIICIGLVSKSDTNDLRILFPKDYTKSSLNFYDPFLNSKISDRKNYCTKLSNLINYFTSYQIKNIEYSYLDANNLLTVISKHTVQTYDIVSKKNTSFLQSDTIQFIFSGDTLKSFLQVSGK
ncbi:MAG: hypothetical protein QM791_17885 [Ferruginibacter sp.]